MVGITSGNTLALEFFRQRPDVGGRGTAQGRPTSGADNTEIAERTAKVGALVATSNAATGDAKPVRTFQGQPLTNQNEPPQTDENGKELTVGQAASLKEQELGDRLRGLRQGAKGVNSFLDILQDPKLNEKYSQDEIKNFELSLKLASRVFLEGDVGLLKAGYDIEGTIFEKQDDGRVALGDFTARYVGDGFSVTGKAGGITNVTVGERANPRGQGVDFRL